MDETDEVFNTLPTDSEDEGNFSELLKAVFKISEGIFILVQSTKKNVQNHYPNLFHFKVQVF